MLVLSYDTFLQLRLYYLYSRCNKLSACSDYLFGILFHVLAVENEVFIFISLSLSLSFSLYISLSFSLSFSIVLSLSLSLSFSIFFSLDLYLSFFLYLSRSFSDFLSLSLSHALIHCLSLYIQFSLFLFLTFYLPWYSCSIFPSLSPSLFLLPSLCLYPPISSCFRSIFYLSFNLS